MMSFHLRCMVCDELTKVKADSRQALAVWLKNKNNKVLCKKCRKAGRES